MRAQRGISLTGFLIAAVIAVTALLLGFKVGPAYSEFYTIQKIFRTIASDSAMKNASRGEINTAFSARSSVENIKSVTISDLQVEKEGGNLVLSASYSVKVPLFYNLSACMEFNPSSQH